MSDRETLETKVAAILSRAWGGVHNVPGWGKRKMWPGAGSAAPSVISVVCYGGGDFATYDFGRLTALVVGAHDHAVRLEIEPASPKYLRLVFHERTREGSFSQRHPTMEATLADIRKKHRALEGKP